MGIAQRNHAVMSTHREARAPDPARRYGAPEPPAHSPRGHDARRGYPWASEPGNLGPQNTISRRASVPSSKQLAGVLDGPPSPDALIAQIERAGRIR